MEPLANTDIALKRKLNFEHAFRSLYCLSRFAGRWSFSIIHDSNGSIRRARIGPFNILWAILIICLNLASLLDLYWTLKVEQEMEEENHAIRIRFAVSAACQISSSLSTIIQISLDMIISERFADILRKFNTFDNEVRYFFKVLFLNINLHLFTFALTNVAIEIWRSFQM